MPDSNPSKPPNSLLESQATGLLWLDEACRLCYLNPAAETLLDLNGRRCTGQPLASSLPGASVFMVILRRVIADREIVTQRELCLEVGPTNARHVVTADCTVTPIVEREGDIRLLVELTPLDRHLRISREAALTAQNAVNRSLALKLAHEIKNPLGGIRGAAQLLARRLVDPGLLEFTRIIVSEADRLTALVDSLLGPHHVLRREPTNIHELLEHVAQLLLAAAPGKRKIKRDYDPSLPELQLDRDQIIQALLNLAKNACEAVGEGGLIVFRSRALRQFTLHGIRHRLVACIEIEDNGQGIAPELLPQLFSPLVSRKPNGSGLGLSIAQELISRHDGLIECVSTPGHTVFSILLPIGTHHEHETA
ncbi:MAG TPA: nitrogen regulation protein NR(II) [Gammaproteobacteria bacterium]|nr:nitrogen regulation protein NR(II) [Gammaproteobacteria bacterium]